MNITASFHGILADWIGVRSASFDLSPNATHADLMMAIHQRYAHNMPEQLWNQREKRFTKEVIISGKGAIAAVMETPLADNEKIEFLLMIAGG